MTTIAALVLTLPERDHLLAECLTAITAQTRQPDDVVIGRDPYRLGQVANGNRLIDATDSEWLAFCDSDDLWHPDHLAVAEKQMDDADVIVSRFELVGRPWNTIEPWHENFDDLRFTNWIGSPSMVVARRRTFGHWCDPYGPFRWIDHANWNRLLEQGARFVDTGVVTTSYRFMGGNGSWRG